MKNSIIELKWMVYYYIEEDLKHLKCILVITGFSRKFEVYFVKVITFGINESRCFFEFNGETRIVDYDAPRRPLLGLQERMVR